jgi:signal recognition particle subunit SRP68
VILYSAERAWSHAMEKRQLPNGPNASQRIYLIGRLRKAVKWASLFSQLCAIKADSRTSLEAEVSLLIISIATKARGDDFYSHQMIC